MGEISVSGKWNLVLAGNRGTAEVILPSLLLQHVAVNVPSVDSSKEQGWADLVWTGADLRSVRVHDYRTLSPKAIVAKEHFQNANGYMACYNVADEQSLERAERLMKVCTVCHV